MFGYEEHPYGFYTLANTEYIVEDRDCKNVPDLDQSHVMELRMLGPY
ncbi:hypothetical protein HID58_028498 [Brassica napus]|uniref:Uncharacterized protein n=1 Tax=Brassica napus TaxID=3708 RepID=A0ABQ8CAF0_BRANA|nr:hypothetical protein HID58_028498 [Brassica napus]